jgi:hypothetical protein
MFVRIVATPPGEAPEEVRQAWVGLELPLASGERGPRTLPVSGVLSGPRSFLGKLFAWLSGRTRRAYGYVIDAPQALVLLAEKAPWAAQWWRERAPHCWSPGHRFVFHAETCEELTRRPSRRLPTRGPAPSEGILPAGSPDVTDRPREGGRPGLPGQTWTPAPTRPEDNP